MLYLYVVFVCCICICICISKLDTCALSKSLTREPPARTLSPALPDHWPPACSARRPMRSGVEMKRLRRDGNHLVQRWLAFSLREQSESVSIDAVSQDLLIHAVSQDLLIHAVSRDLLFV